MATTYFNDPAGNPVDFQQASALATQQAGGSLTGNETQQDIINLAKKFYGMEVSSSSSSSSSSSALDGITTLITPEEIRAREQQAKEAIVQQANATFDPLVSQTKTTGAQTKGSAAAQFGQNRGLGFSKANTQYLNQVQMEIDNKVADLEKQKAAYIASNNIAASQKADDAILALQEQQNNILIKKAELALSERSLDQSEEQFQQSLAFDKLKVENQLRFDEMVFEDGKARAERAYNLDKAQFDFTVSAADREQMAENLTVLAASKTPLEQFDDAQITMMEKLMGLPEGTFESFYDRLLTEAEQQATVDNLTIEKLRSEVNNINSQIASRNASGSGSKAAFTEGFYDRETEQNVRADASSFIDEVRAGTLTTDEAYAQMRTLYSQTEVSDLALRNLFGVKPAGSYGSNEYALPGEVSTGTGADGYDPGAPYVFGKTVDTIANFLNEKIYNQ